MRIVTVHNYYGSSSPSGENVAYDHDVALLRARGHSVVEFVTHSDALRAHGALGAVRGAAEFLWNPLALGRLRGIVGQEQPDILHVHNVFPRLSPAVLRAARGTRTATVYTVHNYRLFCAAGTATRNGRGCQVCAEKGSVLPALRYRCYRASLVATAPVALSLAFHRAARTVVDDTDAFITLTAFQRDLFVGRNLLPGDRVHVRPNFMPGSHQPIPLAVRTPQVAFVGRLSAEKGVSVLIDAWERWGTDAPSLLIIGDGPDRAALEQRARERVPDGRIRFLGRQTAERTVELIRDSRVLVLPSLCFEGFPMVVGEAFAHGVPVVASDTGGLKQVVEGAGAVFSPGDPAALAATLRALWRSEQTLEQLAAGARDAYENLYSEDAAYASLMRIYARALERRRRSDGVA